MYVLNAHAGDLSTNDSWDEVSRQDGVPLVLLAVNVLSMRFALSSNMPQTCSPTVGAANAFRIVMSAIGLSLDVPRTCCSQPLLPRSWVCSGHPAGRHQGKRETKGEARENQSESQSETQGRPHAGGDGSVCQVERTHLERRAGGLPTQEKVAPQQESACGFGR